jgi:hypothetical protein
MSFGVQEEKESRIKADRRPRVNLCSCGEVIDSSEVLCIECKLMVQGITYENQ